MALTAAERKRRQRAHRNGDHRLCDPGRRDCHDVTPDNVTPLPTTVTGSDLRIPDLGSRGLWLWHELTAEPLPARERVLAEEACRLADRCDKFDRILRGDRAEWVRLQLRDEDSDELVVVVDRAVSESRQQVIALKLVLAELRQSQAQRSGAVPAAPQGPPAAVPGTATTGGAGGTLIDLALAARAKRRGVAPA